MRNSVPSSVLDRCSHCEIFLRVIQLSPTVVMFVRRSNSLHWFGFCCWPSVTLQYSVFRIKLESGAQSRQVNIDILLRNFPFWKVIQVFDDWIRRAEIQNGYNKNIDCTYRRHVVDQQLLWAFWDPLRWKEFESIKLQWQNCPHTKQDRHVELHKSGTTIANDGVENVNPIPTKTSQRKAKCENSFSKNTSEDHHDRNRCKKNKFSQTRHQIWKRNHITLWWYETCVRDASFEASHFGTLTSARVANLCLELWLLHTSLMPM